MSPIAPLKLLFPRSRFARNVSILAGGTAAGQALVILASPILARLYTPEDFGLLAVFVSLLMILRVISSLRYQLAIPLPEDEADAANLVVLSLLAVIGVTLVSALIVFFFRYQIADALNTPALSGFLWLLPVALLLTGAYQVCSYWAIRTGGFSAVARTKLTQSIGMLAVQIGGHGFGPISLLLGQMVGQAAGTTALGALTVRKRWSVFCAVRLRLIRQLAYRYRRFPLYSTWGAMFNAAGGNLPPVLFAVLFGPAVAGLYALSHRVLSMPSRLVGRAIGDVFFGRASEASRRGNLGALVYSIHAKLAQIAMVPVLLLALTAPDLFVLLFGSDWQLAGRFAQWLAPSLYMSFITLPLSTVFSVLERQIDEVIFQSILLFSRIAALCVGGLFGDPVLAVALFAIANVCCLTFFLLWLITVTGGSPRELWRPTLSAFGWGVLITSPVILAQMTNVVDTALWLVSLGATLVFTLVRYHNLLRVYR